MAVLFHATLTPGKLELLAGWVPHQPWGAGATSLSVVGAYRFDDPDGEVGLEVHLLVTGDGTVLQVPTTYRAAPLADAEEGLIGTAEHSVLGTRWVYDGCVDPAFTEALTTAILTGATQADIEFQTDDGRVPHPPTTFVRGSGVPGTAVPDGGLGLTVERVLDPLAEVPAGAEVLTGTWPGQDEAVLLASLRER